MASKKFTSLEHRILDNIEILPWTGCWIWMKGSDSRGYGHISVDGKIMTVDGNVISADGEIVPKP